MGVYSRDSGWKRKREIINFPQYYFRLPRGRFQDQMDCSLPEEIQCFSLKQGNVHIICVGHSRCRITGQIHVPWHPTSLSRHISLSLSLSFPPPYSSSSPTLLLSSAKTKDGVQEAFEELVHKVLQTPSLYTTDTPSSSFNVTGQEGGASEEGWGCSC